MSGSGFSVTARTLLAVFARRAAAGTGGAPGVQALHKVL